MTTPNTTDPKQSSTPALPDYLDPHSHIDEITNTLDLDDTVANTAHEIVATAPIELTTGKNPAGVAGGAVYLAALQCTVKQSQLDVADAAGVGESTVRLRFQALAGDI